MSDLKFVEPWDIHEQRAFSEQSGAPTVSSPWQEQAKKGKGIIPEPSFEFFLRAIGVMLLLVVIMVAYFSVRT